MEINIPFNNISSFIHKHFYKFLTLFLTIVSITAFCYYYSQNLTLAFNDARSHLDIGRRVVESLKPGLSQLGSVWLPLPHLLMIPTVWVDFFWHTGLSGSLQSMISFVVTGILIYKILEQLNVGLYSRLIGVAVFILNLNVLYIQSTPMTEMLLLATMTAGCYYLILWHKSDHLLDLIYSGFWIMLSTLIRYDGWFLLIVAGLLIFLQTIKTKKYFAAEGTTILFWTLAGFGVFVWLLWNLLIFKDPFYFAFGPFSAHAQQALIAARGGLGTKGNILLSTETYLLALLYNSYTIPAFFALIGVINLIRDKKISSSLRLASLSLVTPFIFNIIALFLGHSIINIPNFFGGSWFNIRYGIMVVPSIAIFVAYLFDRLRTSKYILILLLSFTLFFAISGRDSVIIDDAAGGLSSTDVTEITSFIRNNMTNKKGFILVSAASHDAILFSSKLPMSRFIHEGTGAYWEAATASPDRWARWIIMRTNDQNDLTWKSVSKAPGFSKYVRVNQHSFADIYEIKPEYLNQLNYEPIFNRQRQYVY